MLVKDSFGRATAKHNVPMPDYCFPRDLASSRFRVSALTVVVDLKSCSDPESLLFNHLPVSRALHCNYAPVTEHRIFLPSR